MTATREALVTAYINNIAQANSEAAKKEHLLVLLKGLFPSDSAKSIIDDFATGAERVIANIYRDYGVSVGRADTQYGTVIIEFENKLSRTGAHAKQQLCEYLSGNWNSGDRLPFTLIATDCLTWKVYAPDYEILTKIDTLLPGDIALEEVVSLTLQYIENTHDACAQADALYHFFDRYLFGTTPVPATLESIRTGFGHASGVYRVAMLVLHDMYAKECASPAMQAAYEEWARFLSMAYGKFDATPRTFLTQTYLSILAKMLAFAVLKRNAFIDIDTAIAREILLGTAFNRHRVSNFANDDFFQWAARPEHTRTLRPLLLALAKELTRYDLANPQEDILKGVYQELVDTDTRHSLGEFYTPDWLCAEVIDALNLQPGQRILDPACGSGSFLKAAANRLCQIKPDISAEELNNSLYGIDIHPLSVQIAKATLIIALGNRLIKTPHPLTLNIFLANTLLLPKDSELKLLGDKYQVRVARKTVTLSAIIFEDANKYDQLVSYCEMLAIPDALRGIQRSRSNVNEICEKRMRTKNKDLLNGAWQIYDALYAAKVNEEDSIWAYILQNSLRPFFLREKFDIVVGNPPWLTFANIENIEYQKGLAELAEQYKVLPTINNRPNLELATIFFTHACNFFLQHNGILSMVLPRSLISGTQHEATRTGKTKGLCVTQIWDLKGVTPLFNIPACVLFARKRKNGELVPKIISGRVLSGKLPGHDISQEQARPCLQLQNTHFALSRLGTATAWTVGKHTITIGATPYKDVFKQGATIIPRVFYFVDIAEEYEGAPENYSALALRTSVAALKEAKKPWTMTFKGVHYTRFLFQTALANNILPFVVNGTRHILLPLEVSPKSLRLLSVDTLYSTGEMKLWKWFEQAEKDWDEKKTERSHAMSFLDRLDYHKNLTSQRLTMRYLVLYCASGKHVCATVYKREKKTLPFIADSKTYVFYTSNLREAHYLCAFLNAPYVNEAIKPFQTRGLYGERDIHRRPLDLPLPLFDADNPHHIRLADIGRRAAQKAEAYIQTLGLGLGPRLNADGGGLSGAKVGRLRQEVRAHLRDELTEADAALALILKNSYCEK